MCEISAKLAHNVIAGIVFFFFGCTDIKDRNDKKDVPEVVSSFGSISEINKSSGTKILDLTEAYGPKAADIKSMRNVRAVVLGDFVGGKEFLRFAGYHPLDRMLEVNKNDIEPVISEDHVGVYGGGSIIPKFALILGHGGPNEIVLIASLSILDRDANVVNEFDQWVVMESSSGRNAPVDAVAGKVLSGIWERLKKK